MTTPGLAPQWLVRFYGHDGDIQREIIRAVDIDDIYSIYADCDLKVIDAKQIDNDVDEFIAKCNRRPRAVIIRDSNNDVSVAFVGGCGGAERYYKNRSKTNWLYKKLMELTRFTLFSGGLREKK